MTERHDEGDAPVDERPPENHVLSRADGRPPEEANSDDPEAQAQAILDDSEHRVAERSVIAETDD
jgi:hypothetical protein